MNYIALGNGVKIPQRGIVAIPKSTHVERMRENLDVFDFEPDAEDMAAIQAPELVFLAHGPCDGRVVRGSCRGAKEKINLKFGG